MEQGKNTGAADAQDATAPEKALDALQDVANSLETLPKTLDDVADGFRALSQSVKARLAMVESILATTDK